MFFDHPVQKPASNSLSLLGVPTWLGLNYHHEIPIAGIGGSSSYSIGINL